MEPVLINNSSELRSIVVSKARFDRYREYQDNGWPLPPLPYNLIMKQAKGGTYLSKSVQKNLSGSWFGEATWESTSQLSPMQDNDPIFRGINDMLTSRYSDFVANRDNKLLSKIKGASLPLIMMYRERHKTGNLVLRFLDNTMFTLSNFRNPRRILNRWGYAHSLNNTMLARLKKIGKSKISLGDKFLEYRFAWTPLYYDIVESLKASESAEKKFNSNRMRVGLPFEFEVSQEHKDSNTVEPRVAWGTRKGWYGVTVNYVISDATLAGIGLLMDVPTTIWDGVKYSFVIDRLADISGYLDRYNATIGTEFTSGFSSAFYKQTVEQNGRDVQMLHFWHGLDHATVTTTTTDTRSPREDLYFKRTVLTSFPKPTLVYPVANWKYVHIADYIALIRQRMKRV